VVGLFVCLAMLFAGVGVFRLDTGVGLLCLLVFKSGCGWGVGVLCGVFWSCAWCIVIKDV